MNIKNKRIEESLKRFLGIQIYNDALNISKKDIREISSEFYDTYSLFNYEIKDGYMSYEVFFVSTEEGFYNFECTCTSFKRYKMCKHVGAALAYNTLFGDIEDETEEEKSNRVFELLTKSVKKEELKLVPILEFDEYRSDVKLKLKIGTDKLYLLGSKFSDFDRAYTYKNSKVQFGKNFTYDPSIHYFSKEDELIIRLYKSEVSKGYYSDSSANLNTNELDNIIANFQNKTIEIQNIGTSLGYEELNPFNINIQKINELYEIKFNFKNHNFLDKDKKYFYDKKLYKINSEALKLLNTIKEEEISKLVLDEDSAIKLNKSLVKKFNDNIIIEEGIKEKFEIITPKVKLYLDYKDKVICKLVFLYNDLEINYFDKEESFRNDIYELSIYDELVNIGFEEDNKTLVMNDVNSLIDFYDNQLSLLENKYEIYATKKFKDSGILKSNSVASQFSIGKDNIMSYNFDLGAITDKDLNKLFDSMKNKEKYFKLKSGKIINIEDEKLKELKEVMEGLDVYDLNGTIPKYRALYLDSVKDYSIIETDKLFDNFINNFKNNINSEINISKEDNKILRDYQKTGVKWLNNIYKTDFGCILADEMGLGKTIQTIVFIKEVIRENNNAKILIVAPTSLIYNWEREFQKFGGELNFKVCADSKNKRLEIINDNVNILITSYGMLRQDQEEYVKHEFDLIVIDEAQNIKNPKTGISFALKSLNGKRKIALTGTPVENSVLEVWSIFDFIMPGFLNSLTKFQSKFNFKDLDDSAHDKLALLQKLISPFILRRRKKDVLKDLPDKMENKIYLDLEPKQKEIYAMQVKKSREEFEEIMANEGFLKARFKILQLLTKLRQICVHPKLIFDNDKLKSVKFNELLNLVNSYKENGHKILIFSSFKSALDLLKKELYESGITFYSIDGTVKSKERNILVDAFNKDDTNAFLITLKAGGTGLNLTGASVVIHLDLWWNPQVENQATDRAHRIGQKNNVEVVKLICKGTIEEKIVELQEKKKILNDALIDADDNDNLVLDKLTEQDIINLLSITEE